MKYIARKNEDGSEQPLRDHLHNVANYASSFASKFNSDKLAYTIGLMHDIGKYSEAFQNRIRGSNIKVDHSTAGLKLSQLFSKPYSDIMGYCISGHHGGIPDIGADIGIPTTSTINTRLKKSIEDYSNYKNEINISFESNDLNKQKLISIFNNCVYPDFSMSFYTRMLYSCLVDSDFLDTEKFMNGETLRNLNYDFHQMKILFDNHIKKFDNSKGIINEQRGEILHQAIKYSQYKQGLYRMTVPTGGGKTISSFAYAINHLLKHNLDRIIYVIPYSTIIEQTANVFKDIFGDEYVLEHHYNYDFDYDDNDRLSDKEQRFKLASQNWDYPIIVTTNVQFFESVFSNKPSRCRKLHNLSRTVIIFDEVQMFPYDYLKPCLLAIQELVLNYGSTVLLSSATQPMFEEFIQNVPIIDIINSKTELNNIFKRVNVKSIGLISDDSLVNKFMNDKQVLIIVNTRKKAYKLYKMYERESTFYLSTLLTPFDRKNKIKEIKARLKKGLDCCVISTQLIEAGVDIDFPVVYREIAGIDSIVQSAGRCNREGKQKIGNLYVFTSSEDESRKVGHIQQGKEISKIIINEFDEIISDEAVKTYFKKIYQINDLDKNKILSYFIIDEKKSYMQYYFKTAANNFKLIENSQKAIIIMTESNQKDIEKLEYIEHPSRLLNKLQKDTVMVYDYEFQRLFKDKKIIEVFKNSGIFYLSDFDLYSEKEGLGIFSVENERTYIY